MTDEQAFLRAALGIEVAGTLHDLRAAYYRMAANGQVPIFFGTPEEGETIVWNAGDERWVPGEAAVSPVPELLNQPGAAAGYVLSVADDGESLEWVLITGGEAGSVTSNDITDATTVGKAVLVAANAAAGRTALGLGTAAVEAATAFATAAQGALADTAVQPAGLSGYAPLADPTFTGTPDVPTAAQGTNGTQIASTAFVNAAVDAAVNALVGTAAADLNTLGEISDALNDDANLYTTLTGLISAKFTLPADPNADRILFWDDSAGGAVWLSLSGLTITGTTLAVDAATESVAGKAEVATSGEITTGTDDTRFVSPLKLAGALANRLIAYNDAVGMWMGPSGELPATGDQLAGVLYVVGT